MPRQSPARADVEDAILGLLAARASGATICPSEVARALDASAWRGLMPHVREAAADLARRRKIELTQRGRPVDPARARGPIRLRLRTSAS